MLKTLNLHHFRSYPAYKLELSSGATIIVGPNARGKTSLLEAIYLLATGESFRAEKIAELVRFEQELGRVSGEVNQPGQDSVQLEVTITRGMVQNQRAPARIFAVNGIKRQRKNFLGHLYAVLFRPEDLRLMEGSPSRRRSYLDEPLSVLFPEYRVALQVYEQTIVRRNKLLWSVREGEMPSTVLSYWNQTLLKHGQTLQRYRREYLSWFANITFPLAFRVEYVPSVLSEARQLEYLKKEIAAGHSLIGPHKDDLLVWLDTLEIATYGSRGQQRWAVLWLKWVEFEYVRYHLRAGQESNLGSSGPAQPKNPLSAQPEDFLSTTPLILLLDDIFSELDAHSRQLVMQLVRSTQTVITTTEAALATELQKQLATVTKITLEWMNRSRYILHPWMKAMRFLMYQGSGIMVHGCFFTVLRST